jgi:hypothetical protein
MCPRMLYFCLNSFVRIIITRIGEIEMNTDLLVVILTAIGVYCLLYGKMPGAVMAILISIIIFCIS